MNGEPHNACPACGRGISLRQALFHDAKFATPCGQCGTRLLLHPNKWFLAAALVALVMIRIGTSRGMHGMIPALGWIDTVPTLAWLPILFVAWALAQLTFTKVTRATIDDPDRPR